VLSALLLAACSETGYVSTKSKAEETGQEENKRKEKNSWSTRCSKPVKINEIASIDIVTYNDEFNDYKTKIDLSIEDYSYKIKIMATSI
jgi:hypothetical protein